jgi:hypothetical protein
MDRPQPKELVVARMPAIPDLLRITVASEDARQWITREAPVFGTLIPPAPANGRSYYLLDIADTYAVAEVAAYLQSYDESSAE